MSKKAQGLSLNTIVIAALALLVLSILSLLFIGRMNLARDDINDCQTAGGTCIYAEQPWMDCEHFLENDPRYDHYSAARQSGNSCRESHGEDHICCIFA